MDLSNKTDNELEEIIRDSIDNSYVPGSIHHRAKLELELRYKKRPTSTVFRTYEEARILKKKRGAIKWNDTVPGLIIIGVIISGISTYLFQKDKSDDVHIQGDDIIIGNNNNNIKSNTVENKHEEEILTEYIFINNLCYITAISDRSGKILSYSVTTRSRDFNPELRPYSEFSVKLAKTKFSELPGGFEKNEVNVGAHNFHYQETYYFGNPGNYLTYIFSINDAGYVEINTDAYPTIFDDLILKDPQKLKMFRENSFVNTYTVTDIFFTSDQINKISSGPRLTNQVWIVDKNADIVNRVVLTTNLKKLAPGASIDYFKKILGEPVFINKL